MNNEYTVNFEISQLEGELRYLESQIEGKKDEQFNLQHNITKSENELSVMNDDETKYQKNKLLYITLAALSGTFLIITILGLFIFLIMDVKFTSYHKFEFCTLFTTNIIAFPIFLFTISFPLNHKTSEHERKTKYNNLANLIAQNQTLYNKNKKDIADLEKVKSDKEQKLYDIKKEKKRLDMEMEAESSNDYEDSSDDWYYNFEHRRKIDELNRAKEQLEYERRMMELDRKQMKYESDRINKDIQKRLREEDRRKNSICLSYTEREKERKKAEIWRDTLRRR